MMTVSNLTAWSGPQSPAARLALLLALGVLALFTAGFIVGFGVSIIEQGHLPRKPIAWAIIAAALLLCYALYRAFRLLLRPSLTDDRSPYERRYARMWMIVMALGVPLGIGLSLLSVHGDPRGLMQRIFIDGQLPPLGAGVLAILLVGSFTAAIILYHRAIDDHEERAYLWGSQIGYYFLALTIPAYWLLERGNAVPALTAGIAMLMLLASFVVQGAVWALFKFR